MDLQSLLTYGLGILVAGIGFLLKQLWNDIRDNKENAGKLKGKIELVDQKLDQGLDRAQHISSLKFKQLNEKLDIMCNDIKEDLKEITDDLKLHISQRPARDEKGRFKKREGED